MKNVKENKLCLKGKIVIEGDRSLCREGESQVYAILISRVCDLVAPLV